MKFRICNQVYICMAGSQPCIFLLVGKGQLDTRRSGSCGLFFLTQPPYRLAPKLAVILPGLKELRPMRAAITGEGHCPALAEFPGNDQGVLVFTFTDRGEYFRALLGKYSIEAFEIRTFLPGNSLNNGMLAL